MERLERPEPHHRPGFLRLAFAFDAASARALAVVAVVGLVVEDAQWAVPPVRGEEAIDHLVLALRRRVAVALRIEAHVAHLLLRHRAFDANPASRLPCLEVDDGDAEARAVPLRPEAVVERTAVLDLGQPVPDGQVRHEDHEVPGVPVLRLPEHEHRHHERLSGAGGELERDPGDRLIVLRVEVLDPLVERRACGFGAFGEEDRGLHRVALAEVGLEPVRVRVVPVIDERHRRRPGTRVSCLAPLLDGCPNLVDLLVRLDFLARPVPVRQVQRALSPARPRHRQVCPARSSPRYRWFTCSELVVETPVPRRGFVRGVDDWRACRVLRTCRFGHVL